MSVTAVPDNDPPQHPAAEQGNRNLPVPVARQIDIPAASESWFGRIVRAVFGWKPGSIRADLEVVLGSGGPAETGFSPDESRMLKNILGLRERRVADVMVPRADIVAVQQDISLGELVKVFEVAAHSRLVAYDDSLDDPVGMVHIRDLIAYMTARATVSATANAKRKKPLPAGLDFKAIDLATTLNAAKIVRKLHFVPPSMSAIDLLAKMQATRIHLALVIDEYGGTDGLVSIEDIVEQIVGEIDDEHDDDETPGVVLQPDGSYLADARAALEDVIAAVGPEFDVEEASEDVDTLSGYLVMRAGRVPVRGELVPGPLGFEIEVLDTDPRRVKRARIHRSKDRDRERSAKRHDSALQNTTSDLGRPGSGETAASASDADKRSS